MEQQVDFVEGVMVSTIAPGGIVKSYETAVRYPNGDWDIVRTYDNEWQAIAGHTDVVSMLQGNLYYFQEPPEILSEDWLIKNLPEGWVYDCQLDPVAAFTITATDGKTLTIPLSLLRKD